MKSLRSEANSSCPLGVPWDSASRSFQVQIIPFRHILMCVVLHAPLAPGDCWTSNDGAFNFCQFFFSSLWARCLSRPGVLAIVMCSKYYWSDLSSELIWGSRTDMSDTHAYTHTFILYTYIGVKDRLLILTKMVTL